MPQAKTVNSLSRSCVITYDNESRGGRVAYLALQPRSGVQMWRWKKLDDNRMKCKQPTRKVYQLRKACQEGWDRPAQHTASHHMAELATIVCFQVVCLSWCKPCLCYSLSASKYAWWCTLRNPLPVRWTRHLQKILMYIHEHWYLGYSSLVLASFASPNLDCRSFTSKRPHSGSDEPDHLPRRICQIKTEEFQIGM